jgi:putative flippase GtrA
MQDIGKQQKRSVGLCLCAMNEPRQPVTSGPDRARNGGRRKVIDRTWWFRLGSQFSRFTLVGVVGTAIHYGVMGLLVELKGIPAVRASAAGFLISAFVSYWLNYRITFSSSIDHRIALPRFLTIGLVGLGLNSVVVGSIVALPSVHWLRAQIVATAIVLSWNFIANRCWTFAGESIV